MHRRTFVSRPERPNETRRGGTRRAVAQIRAAPRNLRLSPRETTYRDLTSPRVKEFPPSKPISNSPGQVRVRVQPGLRSSPSDWNYGQRIGIVRSFHWNLQRWRKFVSVSFRRRGYAEVEFWAWSVTSSRLATGCADHNEWPNRVQWFAVFFFLFPRLGARRHRWTEIIKKC